MLIFGLKKQLKILLFMAKIINLFEKQKFFDFYLEGLNDKYFDYFLTTDLGKIYMSFPWEKYVLEDKRLKKEEKGNFLSGQR